MQVIRFPSKISVEINGRIVERECDERLAYTTGVDELDELFHLKTIYFDGDQDDDEDPIYSNQFLCLECKLYLENIIVECPYTGTEIVEISDKTMDKLRDLVDKNTIKISKPYLFNSTTGEVSIRFTGYYEFDKYRRIGLIVILPYLHKPLYEFLKLSAISGLTYDDITTKIMANLDGISAEMIVITEDKNYEIPYKFVVNRILDTDERSSKYVLIKKDIKTLFDDYESFGRELEKIVFAGLDRNLITDI